MGMTSSYRSLTLEGASVILGSARARAEELMVPVCIAIVDAGGSLVCFERMDGAARLSIQLAQDKAYTVTAFGLPTIEWYPMIKDEPSLLHGIVKADRLMVFGGGVPVTVSGEIVGAIGVSGGTEAQDHEIATAGAASCSP